MNKIQKIDELSFKGTFCFEEFLFILHLFKQSNFSESESQANEKEEGKKLFSNS
jgi:hypothetical protein